MNPPSGDARAALPPDLRTRLIEIFAHALLADMKATETTQATGVAPALKAEEQPSRAP